MIIINCPMCNSLLESALFESIYGCNGCKMWAYNTIRHVESIYLSNKEKYRIEIHHTEEKLYLINLELELKAIQNMIGLNALFNIQSFRIQFNSNIFDKSDYKDIQKFINKLKNLLVFA